jgi:hypothetical protein
MKFKLGLFENARTFFSTKGNTTVIRDTFVNQTPPPQPETLPEPEIEVVISGEPTLEILAEETPAPKNTRTKK